MIGLNIRQYFPLPKSPQLQRFCRSVAASIIRFVCLFVCNDQSFGPYIKGFANMGAFIKYEKFFLYFFVSFASRYMWVEMKLHLHQPLSFALKLYLRFTVSVLRTTRGIQYDTLRHGIVFTALEKKNESWSDNRIRPLIHKCKKKSAVLLVFFIWIFRPDPDRPIFKLRIRNRSDGSGSNQNTTGSQSATLV